MRRLFQTLSCCLLLIRLTVLPAFAQETTATVNGTVTDSSGGVLPGVVVTLKHVATNLTFEGRTNTGAGMSSDCPTKPA